MLRVAKAPSQFCLLTDLKLIIRKHSGFLLSLSCLTRINITLTMNISQHQPRRSVVFCYVADLFKKFGSSIKPQTTNNGH